jgi:uncharacterized protein (TIGR02145 family)
MYKKILILFLLFSLLFFSTKSQTITNVVAKQDGNTVVITYDLKCEGDADISLSMSEDGGSTFKGPLKSVSGDIGIGIKPGSKTITWNTLKDQNLLNGENIVFRVSMPSKFSKFTDSRDGKIYKTVKIGTQTWMAENLAYKTTSGSWAYDNNESNVAKYGYLYEWETAKNACPIGWHLPSDDEWETLVNYLGGNGDAGGKLKEAGIINWQSPNKDATNETGFTALPGGNRSYSDGAFRGFGTYSIWWSSTESSTKAAWFRFISHSNNKLIRFYQNKGDGSSVRCVRD